MDVSYFSAALINEIFSKQLSSGPNFMLHAFAYLERTLGEVTPIEICTPSVITKTGNKGMLFTDRSFMRASCLGC